MHPILCRIPLPFGWGAIPIHTYGLMLMLAFLMGTALTVRRAQRAGIRAELVLDLALYALVAGIIGARAAFLIFDDGWNDPASEHPLLDMVSIWKGGLTFQGGLVLGLAVCLWYMRSHRLPVGKIADLFAPGLALGVALGRVGCFLNGCCWGRICPPDFPLGVSFPRYAEPGTYGSVIRSHWDQFHERMLLPLLDSLGYRDLAARLRDLHPLSDIPPAGLEFIRVHPTQLYSTAALLGICLLLLALERLPRRFEGAVMLAFLMAYSVFRFSIEFLRDDTPLLLGFGSFPGLHLGQILSILVFGAALGTFIHLWRSAGRATVTGAGETP